MIRFPVQAWFNNPPRFMRQNSAAGNAWFDRTAATSDTGGYSVVVSTTLINSDSIILQGFPQARTAVTSYGAAPVFVVATIAPGVSFKLQNVNSVAVVGSFTVGWMIVNPR